MNVIIAIEKEKFEAFIRELAEKRDVNEKKVNELLQLVVKTFKEGSTTIAENTFLIDDSITSKENLPITDLSNAYFLYHTNGDSRALKNDFLFSVEGTEANVGIGHATYFHVINEWFSDSRLPLSNRLINIVFKNYKLERYFIIISEFVYLDSKLDEKFTDYVKTVLMINDQKKSKQFNELMELYQDYKKNYDINNPLECTSEQKSLISELRNKLMPI